VLHNLSVEYGTRLSNRTLELIDSLAKSLPGEPIGKHCPEIERLHICQMQLPGQGA
jgi:hypothetical protein